MELVKILKYLDKKFPQKLMAKWDHSGLQNFQIKTHPNLDQPIEKVLVCLDLTKEIAKIAVKNNINLIITRHPFIFTDLKNENLNPSKKKIIKDLIDHNILVFSIHTNYDASPHNLLITMLEEAFPTRQIKNFGLEKEGYEVKLKQAITPKFFRENIVKIFPTLKPLTNQVLAKRVEPIKEFLVVTGSGGDTLVNKQLTDVVFVTGDLKWHEWLYAQDNQVAILALGHEMENYFVKHLVNLLKNSFPEVTIMESSMNIPYQVYSL
ncbi:dinuclear metal center YbgI/SA1388 family protein [Entomoplasma freundtii]|uniref:GTP cyclohydrolase 1 type 2 homolog n=1 Tax=Entomoplasma freundtii TaxID=74700 RepID=A0A2K8NRA9_9MOLU|nr:Nif3-like dinuclear metal center hexameric protein [Entomoplasma freundtii]ATZ16380.1 Nif3-like dinuclear metal center hexameric protein [Entomoplasma freundtii]TDY56581.1 dinuclear metal center YbgI/SA1388 family protein [Entomoplasma freundtii]